MAEYITEADKRTGDPYCDLLAAVYRQAIRDALDGKENVRYWLDYSFPEWRAYVDRMPRRAPRKRH